MSHMSRLDMLTDSLLPEILYFLPTKDAVRASLISKRWINLWIPLPILDFNFADFCPEDVLTRGPFSTNVSEDSECHQNFVRFIDGVLASRGARQVDTVDTFKLVWEYLVKCYRYVDHPVRRWILLILQQKPRVLSIHVQPYGSLEVPEVAFACSSLVEMKLQVNSTWPIILQPELVDLPQLRKLNLGYFTIKGDFMDRILLGCPNLEELELFACGLNLSRILGGNLRSLVLDGCSNFKNIRVSIPTLQYFKVTVMSCQSSGIILENMSSLVKACVCFLTADDFPSAFYNSKSEILSGLSGVRDLELVLHGYESKRMLWHALLNCPDFENLEVLYLESFDGSLLGCMDMLDCLMLHSPILEVLSFYCCEDGYVENELLEELRELAHEYESCWLKECGQGHVYDSLDKLKKQLMLYMMRFEKMRNEIESEQMLEEMGDEEEEEEEENEEEAEDDEDGEDEAEEDLGGGEA